MNRIIIVLFYAFAAVILDCQIVKSQDYFEPTEVFRFDGPISMTEQTELNGDGINEIAAVLSVRTEENDYGHQIAIYVAGEQEFISEIRRHSLKNINCFDFNSDGYLDILCETYNAGELELYPGPDYEFESHGVNYYQGVIRTGDDWILADSSTIPLVVAHTSRSYNYNDPDSSVILSYSGSRIWQGTWLRGRPESICCVCDPYSYTFDNNVQYGGAFFAAGFDFLYFEIDCDNHPVHREDVYFQLFTNYRREFHQPDSLTMLEAPQEDEDEHEATYYFGYSFQNIVEDIDNDGELDWIQPYWERSFSDTFTIHIPVFDPVSLEIRREYVCTMYDFELPGNMPPRPIKGVSLVDVDNDGSWEILVALQNEPLIILDSETMEVIMESDFIYPDAPFAYFYAGRFDRTYRVQVMLNDSVEFICYNLPEEWNIPQATEPESKSLPRQFSIEPAYPNPFNAATTLSYTLPRRLDVELSVWDITGRKISVLDRGSRGGGQYRLHWRADGLSSGVYFVILKSAGREDVRKVNLVR